MLGKKLLIIGLFGLLTMNEGKAEWQQIPATTDIGGKIELVNWCDWHPNHRKCHRHKHRHWHAGPQWYHKDYQYWWKHCHKYKHRGNPSCKAFCSRNPSSCY